MPARRIKYVGATTQTWQETLVNTSILW